MTEARRYLVLVREAAPNQDWRLDLGRRDHLPYVEKLAAADPAATAAELATRAAEGNAP